MHDAFISYSRRNADFARRLEKALEEFKPPRDLDVPQRYLDVFRDEADFTGVEYFQSVEQHLGDSAKMILICSPAARASTYVGDEVRRFAQKHGAQNVIPVLLEGVPNNEAGAEQQGECAFPDALCELMAMPLAISYRGFDPRKDKVNKGAFADSWFMLLANLYGISRADVERREKRRQARNRRIVAGVVGGIIAALTVALVVSLLFWRRAEADRLKAENASIQERLAKEKEREARLEEQKQRTIADEKRKEAEREFARAEREKAVAEREAIAARSETAGRMAVQALEKADGKPHEALELARAAVNTFHSRGDPVTPRAIGALQRIALAFAGSRPALPWKKDRGPVAVDVLLRLAAASDADGTIVFGKAGTSSPRVLPPPRGVLRSGEQWAREKAHLAFAGDRLIAMRGIVKGNSKEIEEGILWSWHLGEDDVDSPPVVAARFAHGGQLQAWENIELDASPDGRWALWGSTWSDRILQRLDRPGEPFTCESDCTPRQFTDDSRFLLIYESGYIRRFALGDAGATALPPLEVKYGPDSMAVIAREDRMRVATFALGGEAEWWDINGATVEHHELPNVFPAFTKDLETRYLGQALVRTKLAWDDEGEALLLTVVEYGAGEFGFAAVHDLKGDAWQPAEHRYELKANERTSKDGYSVKNAGNLGVASAKFVGGAVLSVGFDGTVVYRDVDKGRVDEKYDVVATGASFADFFDELALIGKRDGKVLFSQGDEEENQTAPLNGHNAPITEVRWTWGGNGNNPERMLSTDATGHTRVWDLTVPGAADSGDRMRVTADWKWLIARDRVWPLDGPDPLWSAQSHPALAKHGAVVAWNAEGTQFATLDVEENAPLPLVLRLWTFRDGRLPRAPVVERRFGTPTLAAYGYSTFQLATPNGTARVLLGNGDRLWMTDLRRQQPLRGIGDAGMTLLPNGASADFRWLVAKRGEETVLIDTGLSKVMPLAVAKAESVSGWSGDGRWLVIRTGFSENSVIDLTAAKPRPVAVDADYIVLGKDRPPLTGSYTGNEPVHMWQAPGRFVELAKKPHELAWDPSGRWLAIGHDAGRVWLTQPPAALTAKELSAHIGAAMKQPPLPQPAEVEARGDIYQVFAFPDQGCVIAELDDHLLVWHRGVTGTWEQPTVFTMKELRTEGIDNVQMRADGRMALIDNHVLILDPANLMAYSRRLVNGAELVTPR